MVKIKKIIIFIFLSLIFSLFPVFDSDSNISYSSFIDETFEISELDVEVTVTDERIAYFKETINVDFNEPRCAIIRYLPMNGDINYRDIKVANREYSVVKDGKFYKIDMDAENFTPSLESKTYILEYTLDFSDAISSNSDYAESIPLNVVGQGWPTSIHSANIVLTLPDTPLTAEYFVGIQGITTGFDRLTVINNGNIINISTVSTLQPYEGITVLYEMPSDTMASPFDTNLIIFIVIGALLVLGALLLFYFLGRDTDIIPIVNFTAPKNMTPAEVGYLIDHKISNADMTSLIFYWASHGHMKIIDQVGDDFTFIKKSNLDDDHYLFEEIMFNRLFSKKNETSMNELKENYYTYIDNGKSAIIKKHNKIMYDKNSFIAALAMTAVNILFFIIAFVSACNIISTSYSNGAFLLSIIFGAVLLLIGISIIYYEPKLYHKKIILKIIYFMLCGLTLLLSYKIIRNAGISQSLSRIISATFAISMSITPFIMNRTEKYNEILNNLLGFKDFITLAEKEKLEALLEENPSYYYDILPYANVLGVSDIWEDKFKSIAIAPPDWYTGTRHFHYGVFNSRMSHSMSSRPASTGGGSGFSGGGGGGGFSGGGGGFGGGGGGSR